jgi:hypothetical protein
MNKSKLKQSAGSIRRKEALQLVESYVCRNRQDSYGDAEDNFANIAAMMNIRFQRKLGKDMAFNALDVASMMVIVKECRKIQSPEYADNWHDQAGYAICGSGIISGQTKKSLRVKSK